MQETVYMKAEGNRVVYKANVTIQDVLKVECTNASILRTIKQMSLYHFNHEHSVVFSILKVILLVVVIYFPQNFAGITNCNHI